MGRTIRSKLLAAKRPRLVPVLDAVVSGALPPVDDYWAAFQATLSTSEARLLTSVPTVSAGDHVRLLRRVDVVLWMASQTIRPIGAAINCAGAAAVGPLDLSGIS
jgi:hypothetical protein